MVWRWTTPTLYALLSSDGAVLREIAVQAPSGDERGGMRYLASGTAHPQSVHSSLTDAVDAAEASLEP